MQNTTFTSTPIHYVKLKKITNGVENGFVKAVFSKLNQADEKDRIAIQQVQDIWGKKEFIANSCCENFFKEQSPETQTYNCIELISNAPLGERIIGLAKSLTLDLGKTKIYHLSWLASKLKLDNPERGIKGVGEVLLGEVFNKAKNKKMPLEFTSSNDSFYFKTFKNAGLDFVEDEELFEMGNGLFTIQKRDFDKYINYCQKKYGTDFSAKIKEGIQI